MSAVSRRELIVGRLRRALRGDAGPTRPRPVHDVSRDIAVYDADPLDDRNARVTPDAAHPHEETPPPWLTNAHSPS